MKVMRRKITKIAILISGAVVFGIVAAFAVAAIYSKVICKDTWYDGTNIDGVDVSGYSVSETAALLPNGSSYSLDIIGKDGGRARIQSSDIDYKITANRDSLENVFLEQHAQIVFPNAKHQLSVAYDTDYDAQKLWQEVKNCELVKGSGTYRIVSPASAQVVYSEDANTVVVQEEVYGNKIKAKELYAAVEEAVRGDVDELDISDESAYPNLYIQPKIKKGDSVIQEELEAYQNFITRYITWDLQMGDSVTMAPKDIYAICSYSDGEITYDDQGLRDWVEAFCLKYKTTDKDRVITNHLGEKVTVPAGDYGWWLDYDFTVQQARDALSQNISSANVEAYVAEPSEANKKGITISLDGEYETTAFRKDYENYEDWDPDNFVEVCLAEQMVYVHQNGEVVFSCETISGRPVPGRETRKGVYFIKEQQPATVLVGDNYRTPVTYWVRITWTGTGFHAAPWQAWGAWSPTYYQRRGSHGCLNLSTQNAEKIYELTKYKEAVFIY